MSEINHNSIYQETQRALKRIAEKHGLHLPEFEMGIHEEDNVLIASFAMTRHSTDEYYEYYYRKYHERFDLNPSWLNTSFYNVRSSRQLKLIGIDPLRTDDCVVVKDSNDKYHRLKPEALKVLIQEKDGAS